MYIAFSLRINLPVRILLNCSTAVAYKNIIW